MPPSMPAVGDELAGYRLRSVLGHGGMSVVFEAENPRLGSSVALKVLIPEIAVDEIFRTRFLQESRMAASLNHPNVVPIYDVGARDGLFYIAMRHVAGADLRAVLKSQHRISPAQALLLTGQTARALDAAHRNGLVHRDVKPGNILIERGADSDDPDHVYLADFGISKHAASRSGLTATGHFVGTIDYISPEQIRDKFVDGRADQYSLACVLYECLTGRVPFVKNIDAAVIWAHVEEMPALPSTVRPELPGSIDDVMIRALAKEPGDRYPTCRELVSAARAALADFEVEPPTVLSRLSGPAPATSLLGGSGPGSTPVPPAGDPPPVSQPTGSPRPGSPVRRGARRIPRWAAVLGVFGLIVAGAAGGWLASRGDPATPSPGAGGSSSPATAPHATTPLVQALTGANTATGGELPPSSCNAHSASLVTCTNPRFSIASVTFRTFPNLNALYNAYVAQVKEISQGQFSANYQDCSLSRPYGEVSWNHDYMHTKSYSLAQLRSPAWNAVNKNTEKAAGRVFCQIVGSQYNLVWTQNAGLLMGTLTGGPHPDAWRWWQNIHHQIDLPGSQMHM